MKHTNRVVTVFALATIGVVGLAVAAPPLSGAIFTTTVDGDVVNENVHYGAKEDVYLDGGPGPRAPASAAGLPEGDYYFQVTDPSGKDLLSTDHISCRRIHVNEYGVIDEHYTDGHDYVLVTTGKGRSATYAWAAVTCSGHATGTDLDHGDAPENAITVQLYPYDNTPNPGGVYKAWIIPTADYEENVGDIVDPPTDCAGSKTCNVNGEDWRGGYFHGFVGSDSKTDNFKVRVKRSTCTAPELSVQKFLDTDEDGVWDGDESEVTGWRVWVKDPLGVEVTEYTPFVVVTPLAGTYTLTEHMPSGWIQTALEVDGESLTPSPTVSLAVDGTCGESHDVIFGNALPPPPSDCPVDTTHPLGGASAYNLITLDDYDAWTTDVQGIAAVGGSATVANYRVGAMASGGDVLSVGLDLSFTNGEISNGDGRVAGSCSTSGLGTPDGALYCNDASAFDASTLTGELRDLADYLSSLAANGTVTATSWGDVKLTGTATTLNVFDLDLDDVASGFSTGVTTITGFTVTVPSGATAVVNVRGDSDVFMRNGAFTLVGTSAQKVLYNFGADTVITIESVGVKGSVLAPWADVAFDNAHIDGTLVGWTVTGTGQLHDYLFDGTLCLE